MSLIRFFRRIVANRLPSGIHEYLKLFQALNTNMGRSQQKLKASGEVLWVHCPCGYRWSGSSESAKALAYKLHGRKCQIMRGVQPMNAEGAGVVRYQENASVSAQRIVDQKRAEERSLHR